MSGPAVGPTSSTPLPDYRIEHGWLVRETGRHDCAGGTPESSGAHEPQCGLDMIMSVERLHVILSSTGATQWAVQLPEDEPGDPTPMPSEQRARRFAARHGGLDVRQRTILTGPWQPAWPDPWDGVADAQAVQP